MHLIHATGKQYVPMELVNTLFVCIFSKLTFCKGNEHMLLSKAMQYMHKQTLFLNRISTS